MNPTTFERIKCLFGKHRWKRVSIQANRIGFLDECECCGRGRYLAWAGHASTVGTLTREEMKVWHRDADDS
jgi:hypothetical protein